MTHQHDGGPGGNHAVATTDDGGAYRAVRMGPRCVAITEDGLDGIADIIEFQDGQLPDGNSSSPVDENLPAILVWWIYEMRRGLTVTSAVLSLDGRA